MAIARARRTTGWPPWAGPAALLGGLVLAAVGGLVVDLPALALGVKITGSHTPPGISIADTVVQDIGFVLAAVFFAQLGGRAVRAWQFGLRRPGAGWRSASGFVLAAARRVHRAQRGLVIGGPPERREAARNARLERRHGAAGAERRPDVRGGADLRGVPVPRLHVHVAAQLARHAARRGDHGAGVRRRALRLGAGARPGPLAALGFGLCLLYRYTGSLYPCIAAHSLNNSLAFSSLENWGWQAPVLILTRSSRSRRSCSRSSASA